MFPAGGRYARRDYKSSSPPSTGRNTVGDKRRGVNFTSPRHFSAPKDVAPRAMASVTTIRVGVVSSRTGCRPLHLLLVQVYFAEKHLYTDEMHVMKCKD